VGGVCSDFVAARGLKVVGGVFSDVVAARSWGLVGGLFSDVVAAGGFGDLWSCGWIVFRLSGCEDWFWLGGVGVESGICSDCVAKRKDWLLEYFEILFKSLRVGRRGG